MMRASNKGLAMIVIMIILAVATAIGIMGIRYSRSSTQRASNTKFKTELMYEAERGAQLGTKRIQQIVAGTGDVSAIVNREQNTSGDTNEKTIPWLLNCFYTKARLEPSKQLTQELEALIAGKSPAFTDIAYANDAAPSDAAPGDGICMPGECTGTIDQACHSKFDPTRGFTTKKENVVCNIIGVGSKAEVNLIRKKDMNVPRNTAKITQQMLDSFFSRRTFNNFFKINNAYAASVSVDELWAIYKLADYKTFEILVVTSTAKDSTSGRKQSFLTSIAVEYDPFVCQVTGTPYTTGSRAFTD